MALPDEERAASNAHRADLLEVYRRLVEDLEASRGPIIDQLSALKVPVEDAHRLAWEAPIREAELLDLNGHLACAEAQLTSQQAILEKELQAHEDLKSCQPRWEANLEHLRAKLRFEAISFHRDQLPEKTGSFAPPARGRHQPAAVKFGYSANGASSSAPPAGACEAGQPGGRVHVQYWPRDQESVMHLYVDSLREHLVRERKGHAETSERLRHLEHVEAVEHDMLLEATAEQRGRIQRRRADIIERVSEVTGWNIRTAAEHESFKLRQEEHAAQLRERNKALEKMIQDLLAKRQGDRRAAEVAADEVQRVASEAYALSIQGTRHAVGGVGDEISRVEAIKTDRGKELRWRLGELEARYDSLARHRSSEVSKLQKDVEGLQKATRQIEQLATRCLATDYSGRAPAVALRGAAATRNLQRAEKLRAAAERPPASKLEALALRPAVVRLRRILQRCQLALQEERRAGQVDEACREPDSAGQAVAGAVLAAEMPLSTASVSATAAVASPLPLVPTTSNEASG